MRVSTNTKWLESSRVDNDKLEGYDAYLRGEKEFEHHYIE